MKPAATIASIVLLGLAAGSAQAIESLVDGAYELDSDTITSTSPDTLVSTTVVLNEGTGAWNCAVTASADSINPLSGDDNRYIFGLSVDTTASTRSGSDRTIDHDRLSTAEEVDRVAVTSAFVFKGLSSNAGRNSHVFRWSARKVNSSDANMVVDDSSIAVVCSDYPDN
ncbi:MAG: hypothetical protein ACR2RL_17535 [Gammaproteobacteria bacterium]